MRTIGLLVTGAIAASFLYSAVYTVANHYLYFDPDKVAAEFGTSMLFTALYLFLGATAGFAFFRVWRDRGSVPPHRAV